jgi:hypothetical protein
MKKLLSTLLIGSLALSVSAKAADGDNLNNRRKAKAAVSQSRSSVKSTATRQTNRAAFRNTGQMRTQRNINTARNRQVNTSARLQGSSPMASKSQYNENARRTAMRAEQSNRRMQASQQTNVRTARRANRLNSRNNVAVSRETNRSVERNRNFEGGRRGNVTVNRERNITRNVRVTNNWRGERFQGRQYSAFRNYHRQYRHRDWYHQHHNRIVFVFGGAYYFNSGYWYPAWGYNPGYRYIYDGPIYGYNDLSPDQVVVNVQMQLAQDGYYRGPIDGQLGPMTREAIAAFQADRGLAVTAAVDEPTLASLGLV